MKSCGSPGSEIGVSAFARRVYEAVRRIPEGRVSTYARIAAAVKCRSPRAVGAALRANPFAPQVPCHRVIASDLSAGGYRGAVSGPALREKIRRLAREGVAFRNGKLVRPECVWPRTVRESAGRRNP
jgi:methylated-DNA-[protein]-cysteine S-methyltransferase